MYVYMFVHVYNCRVSTSNPATLNVSANGKPVILLLFNAGPLDVTWAKLNPAVHVIMACFFPAQSAGQALFNTLTGVHPDYYPAGRLTMTWPANMEQVLYFVVIIYTLC